VLLTVGVGATAAAALALVWLTLRRPAIAPYPWYGWCGLAALTAMELMLALRVPGATTFFTALAWTFYVAIADAAVYRMRGDSLLRAPGKFLALAALSVPGWLTFEAYNFHLKNWVYVGVPAHFWTFAVGATWAFATIFPGIFETADLIYTGWAEGLRWRPWRPAGWPWMGLGAGLLIAPLVAPVAAAPYLFALVWAGFVFLLEPLHRAWGWPSLLGDFAEGRPGRFVALLLSGAACGFFWEFWNYWAAARWRYVFPILHRYRVFEMPLPGFLGFPPFALECFLVYTLLAQLLLPPRLRVALLERCGSLNARGSKEDLCPRAPI